MTTSVANFGSANLVCGNAFGTVSAATNGGTTTLVATSPGTLQVVGTSGTHYVLLPNATTLTIGHRFEIVNQGSSPVTVQNAADTQQTIVYPYQRALCVCTDISSSSGSWWSDQFKAFAYGDANLWSTPVGTLTTIAGGSTLTAAQMYNGPIRCSGGTLYLPKGSGSNNLIVQLTTLLGYTPPIGFRWTMFIIHTSTTSLDYSIGTGGYRATGVGGDTTNDAVLMIPIWITNIDYTTSPISCNYTAFRVWMSGF